MDFPNPLIEGRLIKRYKRFLSDIELPDGEVVVAHCPNTGSMKRCQQDGARVWLSKSDNPKRKLAYTWELVEIDQKHLACINTGYPNKLVGEAIINGVIEELQGYSAIKPEVKYGEKSRIDWLLSNGEKQCFVEVKNVTLLEEDGSGYFPDAVTDRGRKHLNEMVGMVEQGHRAVLLFCVSHTGINDVAPAGYIDQKYADTFVEALQKGVEVLAYSVKVTPENMTVARRIPVLSPKYNL